jgi:signal transduction histidine kinase
MPIVGAELGLLQIPRLAAEATSARPVWLWSADAPRLLWANAVGAAIFGADTAAAAADVRLEPSSRPATEIDRLAATLPAAGQERLERLRGFGAGLGGALVCACSRIVLPDGTAAILVAANEAAGPSLSLVGRVRRLVADDAASFAAFTPDGTLLHASGAARPSLGGATTLSALGLDALAERAFKSGRSSGAARIGQTATEITAIYLGKGDSRVLVLSWSPQPAAVAAPASDEDMQMPTTAIAGGTAARPSIAAAESTIAVAAETSSQQEQEPVAERRHPLRFVWHMDADSRFIVGSDEFIELVGARAVAACGRSWTEIAADLKLDPDNRIARAIATHETWSGIEVSWPVDETNDRLPMELSGLPVFDRDRTFRGYRGFGVCRDIERLNRLARARQTRPIGFTPVSEAARGEAAPAAMQSITAAPAPALVAMAQAAERSESAAAAAAHYEHQGLGVAAAANVVPFRSAAVAESKPPSLSPVERNAFRELAQELSARLRGTREEPAHAEPAAFAPGETARAGETAAADAATAQSSQQPPAAASVLLDRVPAGVLVHRNDTLLYANRPFLELSGYHSVEALAAAGGLHALFAEPGTDALADGGDSEKLSIVSGRGERLPVEGKLFTVPWNGESALALVLTGGQAGQQQRETQVALDAAQNEIRELKTSADRTAGREARRTAADKADFLAKVSREIRTPLNSIIGFAEVIMAERFGAIGNERYREYLKDMHAAATHLVSLLNDLVDLSKIETGQLDLTFAAVDLNDLTRQCVASMQPQANRARIIIRSALTPELRPVMADARSLRQIVLNLLGNAIKFTGPGGQVIVSTAAAEMGEVVLRVRDTGVGMREAEIEAALDPFGQNAAADWSAGGGLSLPLTRALAEANRANFNIKSAPNAGTLIEISFRSNGASSG